MKQKQCNLNLSDICIPDCSNVHQTDRTDPKHALVAVFLLSIVHHPWTTAASNFTPSRIAPSSAATRSNTTPTHSMLPSHILPPYSFHLCHRRDHPCVSMGYLTSVPMHALVRLSLPAPPQCSIIEHLDDVDHRAIDICGRENDAVELRETFSCSTIEQPSAIQHVANHSDYEGLVASAAGMCKMRLQCSRILRMLKSWQQWY